MRRGSGLVSRQFGHALVTEESLVGRDYDFVLIAFRLHASTPVPLDPEDAECVPRRLFMRLVLNYSDVMSGVS